MAGAYDGVVANWYEGRMSPDAGSEVVDICRDLLRIDTTNVGDPYSGPGERVAAEYVADKLSDVGPALRAATKAQDEGRTTVLEMMVTRELGDPFRRDALAPPTRHLAKYKSTRA